MSVYWHPFENGFDRTLLALFRNYKPTEDDFCHWRDALAAFRRPALVVWGARDPVFPATSGRRIAELPPNARFQCFEHANHFITEDRPEALGRLISAFLRSPHAPTPAPNALGERAQPSYRHPLSQAFGEGAGG
jgi:pimeloyl-ACP methyl ester carboxylesterase